MDLGFDELCYALDAAALVVGASLLWRVGRGLPAWPRDLGILLAFAAAGAGGIWLLRDSLPSRFMLPSLAAHGLFYVLAPLALVRGVWRLLAREKRAPVLGVFLVIAALGAEGLWVYATRVEPRRLTMRRYELESELVPRSVRPIRIVVLSDLQTDRVGDFEARVFEAVASERPDLLLLPGDFLQCDGDEAYEEERRKLAALFAKIDPWPRLGAIAVDGDTDSSRETLAETRVRVIEDEGLRLTDRVQVWGLSSLASRDELDTDALQYCQQFPGLTIVLGHSPDFFAPMIESGITFPVLCVAGHTHGGQVVVPFYGPPITLSRLPRDVAAGGFFTSGDASLVLSRGVGMERGYAPRLRFLCPPELVVVEITGVGPGS